MRTFLMTTVYILIVFSLVLLVGTAIEIHYKYECRTSAIAHNIKLSDIEVICK